MRTTNSAVDLEWTLQERFGLERFRPGQRAVIEQVLQARDVLCVMPTGGGKSLCYQLPALLLDGLTLVVSPLIALMKDQVDTLTQRGIRATLINSTLDPAEQRARLIEIASGRYDLVYVAPERFRSPRFVETMARVRLALLAVDEAHCISEWGHDFRPDYARIGWARKKLGSPPCIALTATATDLVRRDIADQLDLRDPAQFVTGFDRPNLIYSVIEARRETEKLAALAALLDQNPGSAIVYVSSRNRAEAVGQFLERERKKAAVVYHAGLTREERTTAQERFMTGEAEIVVATNAFGMGVDKADIRAVIHYNMPGTLEAYYQEAGRAGRDHLPAHCVLLYAPGDRFLQELFIANEYPPPELVYKVYEFLRVQEADPIELTQAEIRATLGIELSEPAVGTALRLLESAGGLERLRPRENMAIIRINVEPDEPSLVDRLHPQAHLQRTVLLGLEGLVNRRFGEPVYFQPDDFAAALGLDRPALSRALRALTDDLPIDYIPPFRGNAVRIIDRNRRARDLGIDFSALHKRKQQEYDKLERMIRYAETNQCRRAFILHYFGDTEATRCGSCDNCGPSSPSATGPDAASIDTAAGREVILKVLSGVARTKGRFGKVAVAQMLTGSTSSRMTRTGLARLSTFGILSEFRQPEVVQLLDALTAAGLLESREVDRFRPTIALTEEGWAVVKGRKIAALSLPLPVGLASKVRCGGLERTAPRLDPLGQAGSRIPSPAPTGPQQTDNEAVLAIAAEDDSQPSGLGPRDSALTDDPLTQRLLSLRADWAREWGLPPEYILSHETLEALVRARPQSPRELASIKGIGPAKLERFGSALLEVIRAGPTASQASTPGRLDTSEPKPKPSPVPSPAAPTSSYVPTEEWTWRLLDRGFSAAEAAAIRGLEPAVILRHATWVARQGRPVPLEAFLSPETITRWDTWHHEHGDSPPPDANAAAGLWALYLACRDGR
jgi:ATP-dependent DNA helicase RecQ